MPPQPRLSAPVVPTRPGCEHPTRHTCPPLEPLPSPAQVVSPLGLSPAHLEALSETSLPWLRLSLSLAPCFLQDFCCHSLLHPPEGINSSPGLGAQAHLVWGPPSLSPAVPCSGCKPSGLERPSLPHVGLLEWRRGAEASDSWAPTPPGRRLRSSIGVLAQTHPCTPRGDPGAALPRFEPLCATVSWVLFLAAPPSWSWSWPHVPPLGVPASCSSSSFALSPTAQRLASPEWVPLERGPVRLLLV